MAPLRKSGGNRLVVTLKVAPERLRELVSTNNDGGAVKQESPANDQGPPSSKPSEPSQPSQSSPATSATVPAAPSNGDNASDSSPATPGSGTPAATAMGPPTDIKKKGVKRTSWAANGDSKSRSRPGPKKKPRLDDGSLEPTVTGRGGGGHRLGPKANQGAINAGLRALDRSGAPCRRWQKGSFTLKTFTGVAWEIPRWNAPPKKRPEATTVISTSASASAGSSTKENKDDVPEKSEDSSAAGADIEMKIEPPSIGPSLPLPLPVAAAS